MGPDTGRRKGREEVDRGVTRTGGGHHDRSVLKSVVPWIGAVTLMFGQARADEVCGPDQARYVAHLVDGIQPFAAKVSRTGAFAVKEEYPGNGSEVLIISFVDRGKPVFVHRVRDDPGSTATTIRPGKTQSGDPGFAVELTQGSLGTCTYAAHVRDGKFVVAAKGLKR